MKHRISRTIISIILVPAIGSFPLTGTPDRSRILSPRSAPSNLAPSIAINSAALYREYAFRYKAQTPENLPVGPETSIPEKTLIELSVLKPILRTFFDIPEHIKTWVYATAFTAAIIIMPCIVADEIYAGSKNPLKHIMASIAVAASLGTKMNRSATKTTPRVKETPPFNPSRIDSIENLLKLIRASAAAYTVLDTDTWDGIAKQTGTTFSLLRRLNNTTAGIEQFRGKTILVPHYRCYIKISRVTNVMHVTIRGIRINPETGAETTWILGRIQEKVATGKSKTKTPLGSFMIRNRVEKPAWTERRSDGTIKRIVPYGGKDYPYGKEATVIQTDNKFDLHPVGKGLRTEGNFSHGCVRMNPHLARMLWLLIPLNTRGEVVDDRLAIEEPIYPINPGITPAIILSEQSI